MTIAAPDYASVPPRHLPRQGLFNTAVITLVGAALNLAPQIVLLLLHRVSPSPTTAPTITGWFIAILWSAAMVYVAISTFRAKHWVRPLLVGYCINAALNHATGAAVSIVGIPFGTGSIPSMLLLDVLIASLVPLILNIRIAQYFSKPSTNDVLFFYQRAPSWTDRFPFPVLAVDTVVAVQAIQNLMGAVIQLPKLIALMFDWSMYGTPIFLTLAAITAIPCLLIYRRQFERAYGFIWLLTVLLPLFRVAQMLVNCPTRAGVMTYMTSRRNVIELVVATAWSAVALYLLRRAKPAFFPHRGEPNAFDLPPEPKPVIPL